MAYLVGVIFLQKHCRDNDELKTQVCETIQAWDGASSKNKN